MNQKKWVVNAVQIKHHLGAYTVLDDAGNFLMTYPTMEQARNYKRELESAQWFKHTRDWMTTKRQKHVKASLVSDIDALLADKSFEKSLAAIDDILRRDAALAEDSKEFELFPVDVTMQGLVKPVKNPPDYQFDGDVRPQQLKAPGGDSVVKYDLPGSDYSDTDGYGKAFKAQQVPWIMFDSKMPSGLVDSPGEYYTSTSLNTKDRFLKSAKDAPFAVPVDPDLPEFTPAQTVEHHKWKKRIEGMDPKDAVLLYLSENRPDLQQVNDGELIDILGIIYPEQDPSDFFHILPEINEILASGEIKVKAPDVDTSNAQKPTSDAEVVAKYLSQFEDELVPIIIDRRYPILLAEYDKWFSQLHTRYDAATDTTHAIALPSAEIQQQILDTLLQRGLVITQQISEETQNVLSEISAVVKTSLAQLDEAEKPVQTQIKGVMAARSEIQKLALMMLQSGQDVSARLWQLNPATVAMVKSQYTTAAAHYKTLVAPIELALTELRAIAHKIDKYRKQLMEYSGATPEFIETLQMTKRSMWLRRAEDNTDLNGQLAQAKALAKTITHSFLPAITIRLEDLEKEFEEFYKAIRVLREPIEYIAKLLARERPYKLASLSAQAEKAWYDTSHGQKVTKDIDLEDPSMWQALEDADALHAAEQEKQDKARAIQMQHRTEDYSPEYTAELAIFREENPGLSEEDSANLFKQQQLKNIKDDPADQPGTLETAELAIFREENPGLSEEDSANLFKQQQLKNIKDDPADQPGTLKTLDTPNYVRGGEQEVEISTFRDTVYNQFKELEQQADALSEKYPFIDSIEVTIYLEDSTRTPHALAGRATQVGRRTLVYRVVPLIKFNDEQLPGDYKEILHVKRALTELIANAANDDEADLYRQRLEAIQGKLGELYHQTMDAVYTDVEAILANYRAILVQEYKEPMYSKIDVTVEDAPVAIA